MRGKGARLAVTLLTVLPWPGAPATAAPATASPEPEPEPEPGPGPDRATTGAAMAWAPAVGLLLGGLGAAVLIVAGHVAGAGALTGAVLAMATLALLTRGLHLDGLADLADGLGSGKPAGAALAIMRKSDIGPMGVATVLFAVLLQVSAVAQAGASWYGGLVLVTGVVTARLALTWACLTGVPAARPDGLGALVAGTVRPVVPTVYTVLLAAAAGLAGAGVAGGGGVRPGLALAGGVLAGLAVAWGLRRHAVRRLGGITGDVLGALAEVATTVTLLVAACGR